MEVSKFGDLKPFQLDMCCIHRRCPSPRMMFGNWFAPFDVLPGLQQPDFEINPLFYSFESWRSPIFVNKQKTREDLSCQYSWIYNDHSTDSDKQNISSSIEENVTENIFLEVHCGLSCQKGTESVFWWSEVLGSETNGSKAPSSLLCV